MFSYVRAFVKTISVFKPYVCILCIYICTYTNVCKHIRTYERERGYIHTYENIEHICIYICTYKYVLYYHRRCMFIAESRACVTCASRPCDTCVTYG